MTNQQKYTGASLTLKLLEQQGVTEIFGYPGGAIMPFYDALYDSPIKHYLCRHEQGAAFGALGYTKASGKIGVCVATSGPGATNLLTGIADAMADSVPMIAITGQVPTKAMGSDGFQEVDIIGLSLACTKHCFQVNDVAQLSQCITKAFQIAQSGRPGPVLIDIPKDVQIASVEHTLQLITEKQKDAQPASNDFQQAANLLAESKKPMLYVGGGVGIADAVNDLRTLNNLTQIPSVATLKGLGSILPTDPHYLGMLGMHGTKPANLAVQQTDLLIVLGARFDDRVTGKLDEFAPNAKVIHMDIDPAEIDKRRKADVSLIGDLKSTLPLLTKSLIKKSLDVSTWRDHCRNLLEKHPQKFETPHDGIFAPSVLRELSQTLSENSVVTTDVGQHQMWAAQAMLFEKPDQFITSGGLGTMGFGVPAALGAQISRPDAQVITISGDGSFMMNVQELATIKRYQLPVKILLIDNSRLGMVRQWQELFFEERYSETDLSDNPDFVALAKAFDIEAKLITKKQETSAALSEMLEHKGAYLLHVKIDAAENVWPLVPPETANHKMVERSAK